MKFQQYLNEAVYTKNEFNDAIQQVKDLELFDMSIKSVEEYDTMLKDIRRNCKQIIKTYKKRWNPESNIYNNNVLLMRGMRGISNGFDIVTAQKNRQPKDTPRWIHDKIDDTFEDLLDIRPRSTGTFCSGDYDMARNYGHDNYIIFPIGKFDFIWSKTVRDLYITLAASKAENYMYDKVEQDGKKLYTKSEWDNYKYDGKSTNDELIRVYNEYVHDTIERDYELNGSLDDAITSGKEIMVVCDRYYAINNKLSKALMPLILK